MWAAGAVIDAAAGVAAKRWSALGSEYTAATVVPRGDRSSVRPQPPMLAACLALGSCELRIRRVLYEVPCVPGADDLNRGVFASNPDPRNGPPISVQPLGFDLHFPLEEEVGRVLLRASPEVLAEFRRVDAVQPNLELLLSRGSHADGIAVYHTHHARWKRCRRDREE
jgi:hypothetical protein